MFEREIKFIYDFNLNRINKIGSYLTFEQLVSLDIHPAILKYISAEIDFLIFEDRQKLLQDSVFDYSGEKINNYFSLIDNEIKKSKKLSIDYIDKLLLHAISFIVNYLVRPRWTLSRFLFDKDEIKSTAEVKQIINYVYFYKYLTDTLISYIDKKKLVSVEQADIDELIQKIDNFSIESYFPNILDTAVKSMSVFFSIGTVQQDIVPINAVKYFLKEKNLDDHIKKLADTFGNEEKLKYTVSDILKALSSGELLFNLKAMETEQIDEDELKSEELPEFETIDDDENVHSDNDDEILKEKKSISEDKISNVQNRNINDENEIHDQIFPEPIENNVASDIAVFDKNEKYPDKKDATITNNVEVLFSNENNIDNELLTKSTDYGDEESSSETVENKLSISTETPTLPDVVQEDDKFEEVKDEEDIPVSNISENNTVETINEMTEELDAYIPGPTEIESLEYETEQSLNTENDFEEAVSEAENFGNETVNTFKTATSETEIAAEELQYEDFEIEKEEISNVENISEIIEEMESDVLDEETTVSENKNEKKYTEDGEVVQGSSINKEEEISETKIENNSNDFGEVEQPELFSNDEFEMQENENVDTENEDNVIIKNKENEQKENTFAPQIELSELLENKNMNKILKVIFDYDMDDFVSAIDNISECKNEDEAGKILQTIYSTNGVKPTSKEAKTFNTVIKEYFKKT